MKQHPESVDRDLEDEVAEAIEHQYASKLMKSVVRGDGADPAAATAEWRRPLREAEQEEKAAAKADQDAFDDAMQELREESGF